LAEESEKARYPIQRALRRAARAAFLWQVEAAGLVAQNQPLTELHGVGPYLADLIKQWVAKPPKIPPTPKIRQGFLTIPQARKILAKHAFGKLRLRGDLQMHTEWSDGSGTVRMMAEAAVDRGYEYIAITDHAKGLKIAGGINEAELAVQGAEIAEVNAKSKTFRVLRSIELNLNPAGEGDMEISALSKLDIVLGAFHSALRRTDDQTERYLAALKNSAVNILGHPRGRIYNYRLGLTAEWPRVFDLAAKVDKAVEIDSYPDRQDLDVGLLKLAKKAGVRISLGTDAHHPEQLGFIELGLAAAASAGIKKERILNFMPLNELLNWAENARGI
jgi:histidinol phosphatase-like PHP family hydrolase